MSEDTGGTYVDEQAKGGPPAQADDEVQGPMQQGACEGDQPYEREEDGHAGDRLGVDEATQGPGRCRAVDVEIFAIDAGDDGGKCQLGAAKDEAQEAFYGHVCEIVFRTG